jgi:inosine-uridine nucleoside N-ribohydrolase
VPRLVAVLVVSAILLGACSQTGSESGSEPAPTPVVVDTDMGQDDMMALLYLLQRPDVRVEAITVSGTGLAHCRPGVEIALSLLDIAGAPEDVPVSCGPERPLPGDYPYPGAFPTSWRIASDDAYGLDLSASAREASETPAPELLRWAIRHASAPVHLLTLGPLTNVALALHDDPELVEDVAGITIMGGALDVPGNVIRNDVAEFNVWVDPVAAREVIAADVPVTLVALDATNDAPVTAFFADALAAHHVTPEARTVHELFEVQPFLLSGQYFFWDPLSAAIMVEPDLATFEVRTVAVLEGEKETQGQIVDDPRGARVRLATASDALAFERDFLNTLNGDHRIESMRPEPVARIVVGAQGCAYDGASDLPTELVAVALDNPTGERWVAVLASIAPEHTYEDFRALVSAFRPTAEPPTWIDIASVTEAPPGSSTLSAWQLDPGRYGLICRGTSDRTLQAVAEILAG